VITYNDQLYVGGWDGAEALVYNCTSADSCSNTGLLVSNTKVSAMKVVGGNLYAGLQAIAPVAPQVWKYDGSSWTNITSADFDDSYEFDGFASFNERIYWMGVTGGIPVFYEYDGSNWINLSSLVSSYTFGLGASNYQNNRGASWYDGYNNQLVILEGAMPGPYTPRGFIKGYVVTNTPASTSVYYTDTNTDASLQYRTGPQNLRAAYGETYACEFTYNFTDNLDLSGATIRTDIGKSVCHNLPGTSKNILIPKLINPTGAYLCPNATTIADVNETCPNKITTGYTSATIGGAEYWRFSNITGSGGGNQGGDVPEFSTHTMIIAVLAGVFVIMLRVSTARKPRVA